MPHRSHTPGLPPRLLTGAADTLRAVAHPVRLKIVELLIGAERPVGELAGLLKLKQPVVSQHLAALRAGRVVAARRTGRQVYYRLVNADAAAIIRAIHRNHTRAAHFRDGEAI